MIFAKKGISYPLLLVPFVFILIALFSISITTPKSDIELKYGGVAVELHQFIEEHQMYSSWFELGFEEAYYRYFVSYLTTQTFSSCLQDTEYFKENKILIYDEVLLESNSFKANIFSCFDSLENSNSYLDEYSSRLNDFFLSIERPGEDISFDIEVRDERVDVNVTSNYERVRESVEMSHVENYDYTFPHLKIEDVMSSPLMKYASLQEFKSQIRGCVQQGELSLDKCYSRVGQEMFSIPNTQLNVVVEQDGEIYDFVVFRYVFYPGVDIEFRARLRI